MTWDIVSDNSFFQIFEMIKPSLKGEILHGAQLPAVLQMAQFHWFDFCLADWRSHTLL